MDAEVPLGEFIETTLTELIQGVTRAQKFAADHDAKINPRVPVLGTQVEPGLIFGPKAKHNVQVVAFDIAVTATTAQRREGAGRLKIAVVGADLGGGKSTEDQKVSRINFKLAIRLPPQDKKESDID